MNLFDTHTHINGKPFIDNLAKTIEDALDGGIKKMIVVGYDIKSSLKAIDIAYQYPNIVYAVIGIHPTECNDVTDEDMERLSTMMDEPCVVGVGEIGLDYHWDTVAKDVQKDFFRKQINMAKAKNLPVVIHSREATNDTYEILKAEDISSIGGIMHSYAGSAEMGERFIDLNMYLSMSGVLTFKNARQAKEVVEKTPLDRLLIETDCPYLTPEPYRGQTNYPQYTYYVAQKMAELKGLDLEEVIDTTYQNACDVFKIKD